MRYARFLVLGLLALVAVATGDATPAAAVGGTTERVSVDSVGNQANGFSNAPAITPDGNSVGFLSLAANLVPGDTNGGFDYFVHVRDTGETERVTVNSNEEEQEAGIEPDAAPPPPISADGRYVAFASSAANLVTGDTNSSYDVFVRDRVAGTTERVSVSSAGAEGDSHSWFPDMSDDGRYVTFESDASNLVAGDTDACTNDFGPFNCRDIFVHDRVTGNTERVNVDSGGAEANGISWGPAISADGRYVAFSSSASNLVPGDTNLCGPSCDDVFVHDRETGITERISVDSTGDEANGSSGAPVLSADGRYVAFRSLASNLVAGDTNGEGDVFVHDRVTHTTERVSVDSAGQQFSQWSDSPAISADGRFIAFMSSVGVAEAIFVHDRMSALTIRADVSTSGEPGNGQSGKGALYRGVNLSAGGRYVTFDSTATNLVPSDTNDGIDVFVHDFGDTDSDGEWDPFDNCPAWPNPDQNMPPWPVPEDDPDCDGFTTTTELSVGTDPLMACSLTATPDDEDPDAWPPDFDDNQTVNILDFLQLTPPVFNSCTVDPSYTVRKDLNADGCVNILDFLKLTPPVFNQSCTP